MKSLASLTGALAAGSLAAALAGCGTGTQTESGTAPVPLQLTDASTSARAAMAPGIAEGTGASSFVLRTTLPTDVPEPAPVWRLPRASATDAATVASALGISGRPTAVIGGWLIRDDGQRLGVRSDGTWSWGMDCSPGVPVEKESLDVMCASASGGGVAVAPGAITTNGGSATTPVPPPTPPVGGGSSQQGGLQSGSALVVRVADVQSERVRWQSQRPGNDPGLPYDMWREPLPGVVIDLARIYSCCPWSER